MTEKLRDMVQKKVEQPDLKLKWLGGRMEGQLPNLVPNNIFCHILNRNSMENFRDNCLKLVLHLKVEEMIEQMNLLIDWEMEMVLQNKLDPILANVQHALKHPVIRQRRKLDNFIRNEKAKAMKKKFDTIKFIKCIQEKHYKWFTDHDSSNSDVAQPGKPSFGDSFIYDFYKHGKSFKTKIRQYDKSLGLHLPRSKRQVKTTNSDIEMLASMKINSREDNDKFYTMADKLINAKLF